MMTLKLDMKHISEREGVGWEWVQGQAGARWRRQVQSFSVDGIQM